MPSMIDCERGDVVLVGFVFDDAGGPRLRPAVVLSGAAYHEARGELVVAAITGDVRRRTERDHVLRRWKAAGLPCRSMVTGVIRTIPRAMVYRKIGALEKRDLDAVAQRIQENLAL